MKCDEFQDAIAALFEIDAADDPTADQLRTHMMECSACAESVQETRALMARLEDAGPAHRDRALADETMRRIAASQRSVRLWQRWRIAAVFFLFIGAAAAGALLWPSATGGGNAAVAAFIEHVRNAESLAFTITSQDKHDIQQMRGMMLGDHAMRFELPDHRIVIIDASSKQSVMLLTDKRKAIRNPTFDLQPIDFRGILLRLLPNVIEIVGAEVVDGIDALVIRAPWPEELGGPEEGWQLKAWINVHNGTPMKVEVTNGTEGDDDWRRTVISDIQFDMPLDRELFSLDLPDGFAWAESTVDPQLVAIQTGRAMVKILMACMIYQQEHDGRWPTGLHELGRYGIDAATLHNPRYPHLEVGYVYQPPADDATLYKTLVLWEIPDEWGAGINVGYADTHVEFIADKAKFQALLNGDG